MLQHTATCCNTLQHTATNQLPEVGADPCKSSRSTSILPTNTLQHTATHCTSLHLTAPHCNSLPLTAHNAIYKSPEAGTGPCTCSRSSSTLPTDILHYTATQCNSLQHTITYCNTLQLTPNHCKTLQHTATHQNIQITRGRHRSLHKLEVNLKSTIHTLQRTATHRN